MNLNDKGKIQMILNSTHKIVIGNSSNMENVNANSVDFIITSPPYPMIEMWDGLFLKLNPSIGNNLILGNGKKSFDLMHEELDKTWSEVCRVLKPGGIACINIGDATRKIGDSFELYSNHSRIIDFFRKKEFGVLPEILWRKQSNKPNKFMGSGMLPPSAYVTLEHEFVLVFRKGKNRTFTPSEKKLRYESAYFWEERNTWFSDVWFDLKGTRQNTENNDLRERTAAYPFELAYRLINMYSLIGDIVLDPFWGTGTTTIAAMSCARNSIGYELDSNFVKLFEGYIKGIQNITTQRNKLRLDEHIKFVNKRETENKPMGHIAKNYGFGVISSQEEEIMLYDIDSIKKEDAHHYIVNHNKFNYKPHRDNN
jgi:DNA modification methylase